MKNIRHTILSTPGTLFLIQMLSTVTYAVLYSTLILYLTSQKHLDPVAAYSLMGTFLALNYGLNLLGGVLNQKFFSNSALLLTSLILQTISCFMFIDPSMSMLYWALSLFLISSGISATCINVILTEHCTDLNTAKRESCFLWNYSGMNLGFFLGYILAGFSQLKHAYSTLFLTCAILSAVSVLISILFYSNYNYTQAHTPSPNPKNKILPKKSYRFLMGLLIIILTIPLSIILLKQANLTEWTLMILAGLILILIFIGAFNFNIYKTRSSTQTIFKLFLIFGIASLIFWSIYQLAPMALTLFTEHNVIRKILGVTIAPQWVQNINTLVVMIGGPLMVPVMTQIRKKFRFGLPTQFGFALAFMGLGMLVLVLGIALANQMGMVSILWVCSSYILQSFGELLMAPIGYAMIGEIAPKKLQGILMGAWMMISGISGVITSKFSCLVLGNDLLGNIHQTDIGFSHLYWILSIIALFGAIVLWSLKNNIHRLMEKLKIKN